MLEYEDMDYKERENYERYDCDLLHQASVKLLLIKIYLEELDEDQILGKKKITDYRKFKVLDSMSIEERELIVELIHRYPELTYDKLGAKYILEGEFSPYH